MKFLSLESEDALDVRRTGGKGASLARAIAAGHRVPRGFVVPADAVAALRCAPDALPEAFSRALDEALTSLRRPGALYAVRSSAVAEDGEAASFAGQYLTRLGVPEDELPAALREVAASFGAEHADAYQRARGQVDAGAAIVVQRLVHARAAGVAFALDPASGDDTVVVVEANHGLGESVVSGEASPDGYRIKKATRAVDHRLGGKEVKAVLVPGGSELVPTSEAERARRALDDDEARAVAALTERLADEAGHPVDLEWALDDDGLHLLQCRPVTAVATSSDVPSTFRAAFDSAVDPTYPLYSNGNIGEVLPGVLSPLCASTVLPVIDRAFRAQLEETGTMPDPSAGLRVVGFFDHRAYLNVSYLCEAADRSPGVSRDRVLEEFVGKVERPTPAFRAADFTPSGLVRTTRALVATARRLLRLTADAERVIAEVTASHRATTDASVGALTDEELSARVVLDDAAYAPSIVHVWASTFAVTTFGALRALLAKRIGDDTGATAAELVGGLGGLPSADPAFALHELATALRADGAFAASYAACGDHAQKLAALRAHPGVVRARFEAFLAAHGHRGVCEAEPMTPTWREDPTQVVALLEPYLHLDAVDPVEKRRERAHRRDELERSVRARLGPVSGRLVFALLTRVRQFVTLRERLKDAIVLRADRQRVFYREIGRRLVARGVLESAADVPLLRADEFAHALAADAEAATTLRRMVRARRRELALCRSVEVPKLLEGGPRRAKPAALGSGALAGLGVCPGVVEGIARVVRDPRVDPAPHPGEILVAPFTDAGWTPLFVHAAAMVVEVGGLLSHGSVVARELGLPTVVGVPLVTRRIGSGDRIRVDGARGTVEILHAASVPGDGDSSVSTDSSTLRA